MTLKEMTWYGKIVYAIGKFYAVILTLFFFPLDVQGRENLPASGPFIIIANHRSMLEVFFIPRIMMRLRVVFMAKSELFTHGKFINWVMRVAGAFPVKRGTADIGAIKKSLEILKEGDVFAIFPEGTRNRKLDGNLQKFYNGIGYIALLSGAPVIPIFFPGSGRLKMFRRVKMVVGAPVTVAELRDSSRVSSETTEKATLKVLDALNALM